MLRFLEEVLKDLGHRVVGAVADGRQLVESCCAERPDLVVTDIRMPELDGISAIEYVYSHVQAPFILVSAHHEPGLIERAEEAPVIAYLVKPIKGADLETAISIAMRRHAEFQAVHKQAVDLQQALEDRKIIERAKGVLMKRAKLEEEDAFRRLQNLASTKNKKMIEIARTILDLEEAFLPEKER